MAKVSGPLFSVDASGGYAGSVVFTKSQGNNCARRLVTSKNNHTAAQEASRNYIRIIAACQKFVNANTQIHPNLAVTDKQAWLAITPPGKTWNTVLSDNILGIDKASIIEADFNWSILGMQGPGNWNAAATALNAPFKAVKQTVAGGGLGSEKSAGYVFMVYTHALYWAGLVPLDFPDPPIYA